MWVKVDDHFDEHPKLQKAGPLAVALWLAGLAYCNRNLTDGKIPRAKAETLWSWTWWDEPKETGECREVTAGITSGYWGDDVTSDYVIGRLIDAGLWEDRGDYYHVHDYLKYQPSKVDVLRERETNSLRQQRFRERNAVSNAVINGDVTAAPVPVVPKEKENLTPSVNGAALTASNCQDSDRITARQAFLEDFWPRYPRKSGKIAAQRVFLRLVKDDSDELFDEIMHGLSWCKANEWANRERDKIPHAATWLNQRRWEDAKAQT